MPYDLTIKFYRAISIYALEVKYILVCTPNGQTLGQLNFG